LKEDEMSTERKLRLLIMVGVVLLLAIYVLMALVVWGADAANNTGARLVVVTQAMAGRGSEGDQGQEPTSAAIEIHGQEAEVVYPTRDLGCMVGENWIFVTPEMDIYPIAEGWTIATTKCGRYLIPITPSDNPYPYPEPEPYPYPGPDGG
jgi:hypothetical protein